MHCMKIYRSVQILKRCQRKALCPGWWTPREIMMAWFCAIRVGFPEAVTWEASLSPSKFWDERAVGVRRRSRVRRPRDVVSQAEGREPTMTQRVHGRLPGAGPCAKPWSWADGAGGGGPGKLLGSARSEGATGRPGQSERRSPRGAPVLRRTATTPGLKGWGQCLG